MHTLMVEPEGALRLVRAVQVHPGSCLSAAASRMRHTLVDDSSSSSSGSWASSSWTTRSEAGHLTLPLALLPLEGPPSILGLIPLEGPASEGPASNGLLAPELLAPELLAPGLLAPGLFAPGLFASPYPSGLFAPGLFASPYPPGLHRGRRGGVSMTMARERREARGELTDALKRLRGYDRDEKERSEAVSEGVERAREGLGGGEAASEGAEFAREGLGGASPDMGDWSLYDLRLGLRIDPQWRLSVSRDPPSCWLLPVGVDGPSPIDSCLVERCLVVRCFVESLLLRLVLLIWLLTWLMLPTRDGGVSVVGLPSRDVLRECVPGPGPRRAFLAIFASTLAFFFVASSSSCNLSCSTDPLSIKRCSFSSNFFCRLCAWRSLSFLCWLWV